MKQHTDSQPSMFRETVGGYAVNPAARASDPTTSQRAAERARSFAGTDRGKILDALADGPLPTHQIAARTGMTIEQVGRRIGELHPSARHPERVEYVRRVGDDGRFGIYALAAKGAV